MAFEREYRTIFMVGTCKGWMVYIGVLVKYVCMIIRWSGNERKKINQLDLMYHWHKRTCMR